MVKLDKLPSQNVKKQATVSQIANLQKARDSKKKITDAEHQRKLRIQYGIESSDDDDESCIDTDLEKSDDEIIYQTVVKKIENPEVMSMVEIKKQLDVIQNSLVKEKKVVKKPRKVMKKDAIKKVESILEQKVEVPETIPNEIITQEKPIAIVEEPMQIVKEEPVISSEEKRVKFILNKVGTHEIKTDKSRSDYLISKLKK